MIIDRTKRKISANWWWTIDRYILSISLGLILLGFILTLAASPRVANRIGLEDFYFVKRQVAFILIGFVIIATTSLFSSASVRRFSVVGFLLFYILLISVEFLGAETKGAKRWINLMGISVQPSEILKPFFAVLCAWFINRGKIEEKFRGTIISFALLLAVVFFTIRQPDFGMSITFSMIWGSMLVVAGLHFIIIILIGFLGLGGGYSAYLFLPHVRKRVDSFLNPESSASENYQTFKSLQAFESGSITGVGPGQGKVKDILPDAHTDFIFSVAGEEYGVFFCLLIIGLFLTLVIMSLKRAYESKDLFIMLAITGLITQIFVQSAVNMAVAVNLIPNKGMTLPFISYGGSSMVSISFAVGMILALTRKKFGE
ncbi:MAG: putative peptidoglycan glycosyltransferase FtsW [Rickettsiales bacterium]|nr:putative peptidoglycan glycosyltransferase FtsW [Rickettsiales bacterium]